MKTGTLDKPAATQIAVSKDRTPIAYDISGNGNPLLLVNGALSFRKSKGVRELVNELARHFTVITYDRRGRGESGDTKPYSVQKEVEDIAALIGKAGGRASLFGVSSGAALALTAANQLGPDFVYKLALYEPPFGFAQVMGQKAYDEEKRKISDLVAAGNPGEAIMVFFESLQIPKEQIEAIKKSPDWNDMESAGHTLPYDFAILGDGNIPLQLAAGVQVPTLVLDGEKSFAFMHTTADTLAAILPNASRETLKNQTHELSPEVIVPVLKSFL